MKTAKALLKIIKPYYDEETGKLNNDAPENVKEAYETLDKLMNELLSNPELFHNPGYVIKNKKKTTSGF